MTIDNVDLKTGIIIATANNGLKIKITPSESGNNQIDIYHGDNFGSGGQVILYTNWFEIGESAQAKIDYCVGCAEQIILNMYNLIAECK
jgi:hypothetical protein